MVHNYKQKIAAIVTASVLLLGCTEGNGLVIEGRDLVNTANLLDQQVVDNVILSQKEKYTRHFQNGLYFEDLSKPQKELNQLYKKHMRKEIDAMIAGKAPKWKDVPYVLQTEVEYVNQDVKDYVQGRVKAQDIIDNPNSMMKVSIYLFFFSNFDEKEYPKFSWTLNEFLEIDFPYKYTDKGVEYVDLRVRGYDPKVLEHYSIEEIEKADSVALLLENEKTTLQLMGGKNPFFYDKISGPYLDGPIGEGVYKYQHEVYQGGPHYTIFNLLRLKQKYHTDFYEEVGGWIRAKKYPEILFTYNINWDENSPDYEKGKLYGDYFKAAMYQYLANEKLRKLIEDAGLSDRVVFLVRMNDEFEEEGRKPYDSSEGFDKDHFLSRGYKNYATITLIYLEIEGKEHYKKEGDNEWDAQPHHPFQEWFDYNKFIHACRKDILLPLHQDIKLGGYEYYGGRSFKDVHLKVYHVSDYERRVIVDLFRKYPLNECKPHPKPESIGSVFSTQYTQRAETQGFHYIDIFAELVSDWASGLNDLYEPVKE